MMNERVETAARTAVLRRQHDAALVLVEEIGQRVSLESCRDEAFAITLLIARLTGLLKIHFAQEDETLYPFVMTGKDEKAAAVAWRFHAEMGGIGASYDAFIRRWSVPAKIAGSVDRFRRETSVLLAALKHRIERENEELYPLADALARAG